MIRTGKVDHQQLEEGNKLLLDFHKLRKVAESPEPVLPVAVQHAETKEVMIVGYANEAALKYTLEHGVAAFWSTSRNELWVKGATSGDTLEIVEIRVNCEQNSLLYIVKPLGVGACHTQDENGVARMSCYYRRITDGQLEIV
jgi:phosphoribosyl-AMP cyclohydrolase